ncbi:unnamed protein product [Durusdinium trenchii]|uniref:Uncharacterized protein n=1 Tax=Durusdinium trenchii TaxID=1381693 RepID=A0ABP0MI31_9DINO
MARSLRSQEMPLESAGHVDVEDPQAVLAEAAQKGWLDTARAMLAKGASPDVGAMPPLCLAAEQGHLQLVWCLVDASADKELADVHFRRTPLLWAAHQQHGELLRFLSLGLGRCEYHPFAKYD